MKKHTKEQKKRGPNLFGLLQPYKGMTVLLILFTILSNGLGLVVPKGNSSAHYRCAFEGVLRGRFSGLAMSSPNSRIAIAEGSCTNLNALEGKINGQSGARGNEPKRAILDLLLTC